MQQLPLGVRLPDRAVFASFLPARNREAVDYVVRLAGAEISGTVWVCGASGSGKSHLLQAVCARASDRMRAGYLPLQELAPLGVEVLEGMRQLECLCIDDLEQIVGQIEWERGLFGIVREAEDSGARIVVAAKSPPALLAWALPDLGSRLAASAVFQLRALDESEQQEALQLRARLRGFELPEETSRWLQRRFPRDMRALYGILDALDEAALVAQRKLTVPFIRSVLRDS
ncbi:MAG TPA: DnaA regulatory inactivator Hda [Steroidobacteraceae bacterium]|nr:DnaA regulatory inactivator Hda [Steroidobacteraceae bacterium]